MSSIGTFLNRGPGIDVAATKSLQSAVADKLMVQAEDAVLQFVIETSDPGQALKSLQALGDLPRERRDKVLLHPSFRYWLQAMRKTSRGEQTELRRDFAERLIDFVWSEHFLAGRPIENWRLATDQRGGIRCPSRGRYIELGEGYQNQICRMATGEENLVGQCADGLRIEIPPEDLLEPSMDDLPTIEDHGFRISLSPKVANNRIEISTRDPWLRVKLTGTNQRMNGTEFFGVEEDLYPQSPAIGEIVAALELLKKYWPDQYDDLAEFTQVIVPIDASANIMRPWQGPRHADDDDNRTHLAFTVSSRQGAIYIGSAPVDSSVEMLIHENAHVKMRQIQAIDPLLLDPFDETLKISVPWRPDPRPIPGILEGLFVFSHVAEFECQRWFSDPNGVSVERMNARLKGLAHAIDCLERHAKLTAGGAEFLAAMKSWVIDLRCRTPNQ
jgi:HEXXH motif-containing protein